MTGFVEVRALAGMNYVRPSDVVAIQYSEPQKCIVVLTGGGTLSCAEPAAQVKARIEAALSSTSEAPHGNASR